MSPPHYFTRLTSELNLTVDLIQLFYCYVRQVRFLFCLSHTKWQKVEAGRRTHTLEDKDSIDRCANESFSRVALTTLTPAFPAVRLAERLHTSSFRTHSSHILRSPLCVRECTGHVALLPPPPSLPLWFLYEVYTHCCCNLKKDLLKKKKKKIF